MPVVTVTLIEGYDEATRQVMCRRLTRAVRATIAAPLEGTTVIVYEVAPSDYMRGATSGRPPDRALPDATTLVRDFLSATERRDLTRAELFLAPAFEMCFPGSTRLTSLAALVDWAKSRYRFVKKQYERFDESLGDDGTIVYCFGTLEGEWLDGKAFSAIRFIDRFTVRDGKLVDQMVWNDLAEHRAAQ